MMLHCASRMGFLSYVYQQRQQIAYALGIIAEIPIATCSSDYDFNSGLTILSSHDDDATRQTLPVALEIKLFCSTVEMPVLASGRMPVVQLYAPAGSRPLGGSLRSVFHPPALLS